MSSDFNERNSLARPQQRPDILQTTLDDKILVYDPEGRTAVTLNEPASVIWQLCNGEHSVAEIVEILQRAYPEAAATMPHEVDAGVLALLSHRVISLPRLGPGAATYDVEFGDATVRLEADNAEAAHILEFLCASMATPAANDPSATFRLGAAFTPDAMAIYRDDVMLFRSTAKSSVTAIFLERVLEYLIGVCTSGILLHAAAIARNGMALILPGNTGAGKTTLATWLVCRGFEYLTDELLSIDTEAMSVNGFARPLHLKKAALPLFAEMIDMGSDAVMESPLGSHLSPTRLGAQVMRFARPCAVVLPEYRAGARFELRALPKAQAATRLMGYVINARKNQQHGFDRVSGLVESVPAFMMTYADLEEAGAQLETMLASFDCS